jgi:hypothetical protein
MAEQAPAQNCSCATASRLEDNLAAYPPEQQMKQAKAWKPWEPMGAHRAPQQAKKATSTRGCEVRGCK